MTFVSALSHLCHSAAPWVPVVLRRYSSYVKVHKERGDTLCKHMQSITTLSSAADLRDTSTPSGWSIRASGTAGAPSLRASVAAQRQRCGSASVFLVQLLISDQTSHHVPVPSPPVRGRLRGQAGRVRGGGACVFLDAEKENSANTPPTIQGEARVNSCATADSDETRRGAAGGGQQKVSSTRLLCSLNARVLRAGSAGVVAPWKLASAGRVCFHFKEKINILFGFCLCA